MKPFLYCITLLSCFLPINAANIIFDLGDVLIETKYMSSMWEIGPMKFASYASTGKNPFKCSGKLFEFLDSLQERNPDETIAKDNHGNVLPQLMCDWLKGTMSTEELRFIINNNRGNFSSIQEEQLVRSLANMIFTPQKFVNTRYLVPEGVKFVEECKRAGHKVFIISNWDRDSFTLMEEKYPDFFNLFDGIVISGDVGVIKPDPTIYNYSMMRFGLQPNETFFIDDQENNVEAAQDLGIHGIVYEKKRGLLQSYPNFDAIRTKINKHLDALDDLKFSTN